MPIYTLMFINITAVYLYFHYFKKHSINFICVCVFKYKLNIYLLFQIVFYIHMWNT